jgi:hypothetical protein
MATWPITVEIGAPALIIVRCAQAGAAYHLHGADRTAAYGTRRAPTRCAGARNARAGPYAAPLAQGNDQAAGVVDAV